MSELEWKLRLHKLRSLNAKNFNRLKQQTTKRDILSIPIGLVDFVRLRISAETRLLKNDQRVVSPSDDLYRMISRTWDNLPFHTDLPNVSIIATTRASYQIKKPSSQTCLGLIILDDRHKLSICTVDGRISVPTREPSLVIFEQDAEISWKCRSERLLMIQIEASRRATFRCREEEHKCVVRRHSNGIVKLSNLFTTDELSMILRSVHSHGGKCRWILEFDCDIFGAFARGLAERLVHTWCNRRPHCDLYIEHRPAICDSIDSTEATEPDYIVLAPLTDHPHNEVKPGSAVAVPYKLSAPESFCCTGWVLIALVTFF